MTVSFWPRQDRHSLPATMFIKVICPASVEPRSRAFHQWGDEDQVRCPLKHALKDSQSSHHSHSSKRKRTGTLRSAGALLPSQIRTSNRFHRTFSGTRPGIQSSHLPGSANRLETRGAIIARSNCRPVGLIMPSIPRIHHRQHFPWSIAPRQIVTSPEAITTNGTNYLRPNPRTHYFEAIYRLCDEA